MIAKVYLPGRLEGELELAPITVIVGPPRSGKTVLLKTLYNALYFAEHEVDPFVLAYIVSVPTPQDGELELVSLRSCENCSPQLSLTCGRGGCRVVGRPGARPLFVPAYVEAVVKHYRYLPLFTHDLELDNLIERLHAGSNKAPACTGGYEEVLANAPEPELAAEDGRLYEVIRGTLVDIYNTSTTSAKLGVLEGAFKRGLLDEYTHIFFDSPDAGLHPLSQAKLALLMHALANCGKAVVLATHNVIFVDMLTRVERVNEMVGANVKPADVALYAIEGGRLKRYEAYASYIRDYTPYIYALYGYEAEEKGEDYAVFKARRC